MQVSNPSELIWEEAPLCWLSPPQQAPFKHQAQTERYSLAQPIWSTDAPGSQFLVVAGKVRLREAGVQKSITLTPGDWFGDLLNLAGQFKVSAASKDVVVLRWDSQLWQQAASPVVEQFWQQQKERYQSSNRGQLSGYPFIAGLNTAAACLAMAAQQLQSPVRLEWVQRQLPGQRPRQVAEAAEKLGLRLRRLQVGWQDLHQLSFPALLHWRKKHWVVLYGVRGNLGIVANPLNPAQTSESLPQSVIEQAWDGQLWLVEPLQKQEKFNLYFEARFTSLSYLLILGVGAHLVIRQQITVGQLVAFQMLSGRVTSPILRLVQLWQTFQQVLLSVNRLGDILNVQPEAEPGTGLTLPPLNGQINFEQVFFRYRSEQEPILRGVSFSVKPGMLVGVVGRSGSGKSTLSKLSQGLYQPESGRILVDGFDIKSADLSSLRQQIAVVLQDDFLFNSSVLDNITLGNPDITAEQVVKAAKQAAAHEFISDLPQGYETNVGERGTALSGGQRQRIALARLFLSPAPILILDEATSALDSETEQIVLRNLQAVARDRTVFIITHRFEPLKRADLVLVLDKGVLMEQGSHEQLIQQQGVYWSLYQRQQASV